MPGQDGMLSTCCTVIEKVGDVEAAEDKRVTTEVRQCTNSVRSDENSHVQTDSLRRTQRRRSESGDGLQSDHLCDGSNALPTRTVQDTVIKE